MVSVTYDMTESVKEIIKKLPDGLKKKIEAYIEILKIKRHEISLPYADKIEGYEKADQIRNILTGKGH